MDQLGRKLAALSLAAALAAGMTATTGPAAAAEPSAESELDALRRCVEANAPRRSAVQELSLRVHDDEGEISRSRFKLYWLRMQGGGRRVVLRFLAPEELEGTAILIAIPDGGGRPDVHLYLPELGEPQQVRSRQQLAGVLGQAEIGVDDVALLLDPIRGREATLLDGAGELEGRPAWRIELRDEGDDEEEAPASRTVLAVDRERCVPLRAERYVEGELVKVLRADPKRVSRSAGIWVPRLLRLDDRERGVESVLRVEAVEIDTPVAPSLFTVKALGGGAG